MRLINARLIERIKRTPTIESFRIKPDERINFKPGQFGQVIFDRDDPDNKELNKYLSFSSSPTKGYLEITKRLSQSEFSQKLKILDTASALALKAPLGNCVFEESYRKIGFLIGGIGITPVISIIEYIADKKLDTDIVLLYSNRDEQEIAFKKELDGWLEANSNIKICYAITDCKPKDKLCFAGRIDKNLCLSRMPDIKERVLFIFGPPRMVEAMKNLCLGIGVEKEKINAENFVGY
ncbi:MAG: FAD-dependent oxidoreductase [Candidatus Omnitrophica bacterium]|nr:FAD-dependent oxidoreductase [Candidatus Omnitrophota bacterium]